MINKHVHSYIKHRGRSQFKKRTKLRGMRRIRFYNAKSRIKKSSTSTSMLLNKVITMLLLRRTSNLLSGNKSTNYQFRGGFVQCHVSNRVIYGRILSLLENKVSDSSEMLKLVQLSKHINKNGNIK
jgi:hypothetical protein